ncbi:MAG: DUF493 family protein [Nannocystaceae bacterium]
MTGWDATRELPLFRGDENGINTRVRTTRHAPARELLLANHEFPGIYIIKAFGPASREFREQAEDAALGVLARHQVSIRVRETKSGSRSCVTLELHVETVDEIILTYERLYALHDLKLIL